MTEDEARRVLHLHGRCSPAQLRQAYLDLVKVWHPDRFSAADARLQDKAARALQELNAAYDVLRRPERSNRHAAAATAAPRQTAQSTRANRHAEPTPPAVARHQGRWHFDMGRGIAVGAMVGIAGAFAVVWPNLMPAIDVNRAGTSAPSTDIELVTPQLAASRPMARGELARPASGAELITPLRTGRSSLVVQNDQRRDAVVVLDEGPQYARAIYVRAGEQLTILNIAAGTYRVLMMAGQNWSSDSFSTDASYQALERPITFEERDMANSTESTRLTIAFQQVAVNAFGVRRTTPFRLPPP